MASYIDPRLEVCAWEVLSAWEVMSEARLDEAMPIRHLTPGPSVNLDSLKGVDNAS